MMCDMMMLPDDGGEEGTVVEEGAKSKEPKGEARFLKDLFLALRGSALKRRC